jgi:hypothetical protein
MPGSVVAVPGNLNNVVAIAAGGGHMLALKADGTVVGWGRNASGQATGVPTSGSATGQVMIAGQPLSSVVAIAAGLNHSLALRSDGTVVGWGTNSSGQATGVPSDNSASGPVTIGGQALSSVTAIGSGPTANHSLAIKRNGTVVAWGDDTYGQTDVASDLVGPLVGCASSYASFVVVNPNGTRPPPGGVVTNCTETALRAAMANGGTVTFACDGTITLASAITVDLDTVLDGNGHQIGLTGMHGVLYVGTNVHLTVANLAITDSRAVSAINPSVLLSGAGIFNDGGRVTLLGVTFDGNGAASGGAVLNQSLGAVNATNCAFLGNGAGPDFRVVPNWDGPGQGGAILNQSGQMNLQNCLFLGNRAAGGSGSLGTVGGTPSGGFDGSGGAIANYGNLFAVGCTFSGNSARGGNGDDHIGPFAGGWAYGGAIWNNGTVAIASSCFSSNIVAGGTGGIGKSSDPGNPFGFNGGPGGNGGWAYGGALLSGAGGSVVNSTFAWNAAIAGAGGQGGQAGPGYCQYTNILALPGAGGNGGSGGSVFGAISGTVSLTNCSIGFNSATNGAGGAAGFGGGWYPYPCGAPGPNGSSGPNGSANGGISGAVCFNTLLVSNTPNGNCNGGIIDGSHNLSSDASCPFNLFGLTNADAKLGPLANNGGPTLTMALLSGSPAIDTGNSVGAPFTDQRGFPRPAGSAADIGAFEYGSMMPSLSIAHPSANALNVTIQGNSNQWCRLLVSSNCSAWVPMATNQIGANGTVVFQDNCSSACRFYRVVMP